MIIIVIPYYIMMDFIVCKHAFVWMCIMSLGYYLYK